MLMIYHWLIILTIYVAWMTSVIQVSSVIRHNISSLIRPLISFFHADETIVVADEL